MITNLPAGRFAGVLEKIAAGETVTDACAASGVPVSTFYSARRADPDLHAAANAAQEIGRDVMADRLANIHTEIGNPIMARVVSENRRWLLARRDPARYGDRLAIDDKSSRDLTAILREAIARIPRPSSDLAPTIDGRKPTLADVFGAGTFD